MTWTNVYFQQKTSKIQGLDMLLCNDVNYEWMKLVQVYAEDESQTETSLKCCSKILKSLCNKRGDFYDFNLKNMDLKFNSSIMELRLRLFKRSFTAAALCAMGATPVWMEWFTFTSISSSKQFNMWFKQMVRIRSSQYIEACPFWQPL